MRQLARMNCDLVQLLVRGDGFAPLLKGLPGTARVLRHHVLRYLMEILLKESLSAVAPACQPHKSSVRCKTRF